MNIDFSTKVTNSDLDEQIKKRFSPSANILCNYMREMDYLMNILRDCAFKPRYYKEIVEYLHIAGLTSVEIPMTCFCDIPLNKIYEHTYYYGQYGIALNKDSCLVKGMNLQPILYVNFDSNLYADYRDTLSKIVESAQKNEKPDEKWDFLSDMLLSLIAYMKPLAGPMDFRNGRSIDHKDFKDECEWRYIPKKDGMPKVNIGTLTERQEQIYTKVMTRDQAYWLKFTPEDIEYLIVPDDEKAEELVARIMAMRNRIWTKDKKYSLIRKIEISEKFNRNFM